MKIYNIMTLFFLFVSLVLAFLGIAGKELEGNGCIVRNGKKFEQQNQDCCTKCQGKFMTDRLTD